ncbi:MAG TPA: hydroxymethylglutaryl-CoA synthase [Lactobacillaceae bacterium]|jgi:hydroxymethylglutaryl-CoA synthase
MTQVGLDKIGFYTPHLYVDLVELAQARGIDPNKFTIGIGQDEQAVIPNSQDVVTMGANAAVQFLTEADKDAIDMVIFATESGIDHSKSGAVYVQNLLGLSPFVRTIELKQACYAGTYGLMQARDYVARHPEKKALVIASDIARYGLATAGEVTQGGGAVAMLVAADPQIAVINDDSVYMSQDVMDFWRPLDRTEALVDGKYSTEVYKEMFLTLYQRAGRSLTDLAGVAFHLPYTKQGKKALDQVIETVDEATQVRHLAALSASQTYARRVGNLYTASVYLALLSLLENGKVQAGDQLGVFSYGSGAEAEWYSITLQPEFAKGLGASVDALLAARQRVSVADYERIFQTAVHGSADQITDYAQDTAQFRLTGVRDGQRLYQEFK